MFFNTDVRNTAKAPTSDAQIAALVAAGGWGNGNKFQVDPSFHVFAATADTPRRSYTKNDQFYVPDCDYAPIPVPANGAVEAHDDYHCSDDGDCHLLVFARHEQRLYELYSASIVDGSFTGGCLALWNTSKSYPTNLRGTNCASADAAGLPMAPLLFSADEIAAGVISHALRFTLPPARMAPTVVPPATHTLRGNASAALPSGGAHFRLRGDFPLASLPSEGARVVARALQTYGMYLADAGNIVLSAQSDQFTVAKWEGLMTMQDLAALKVSDFDIIDHGPPMPKSDECERNGE